MSLKRKSALVLLIGILSISEPVFAHTEIHSDAGILSYIIAVGLVITSIIIFLLVSRRKKKKENGTQPDI